MKINVSKVSFSSIVGIGQKVKKVSQETGVPYLELNRGVNNVCQIDLSNVIKQIDFNSKDIQVYAPNLGYEPLRKSILKEYFPSHTETKNIAITPGGMPAIDMVTQILNVGTIYFPKFYWGSYSKMATIRNKSFSFYDSLEDFDLSKIHDSSCIFICDPSNPTGVKMNDDELLAFLEKVNKTGATVVFDSPYRKLFFRDNFFDKVAQFENVIITESFSKWIGLSGARLGFIWSTNKEFNEELNIRILYEFNGISSPSQLIVNTILSTPEGNAAAEEFRKTTTDNIRQNIDYLAENGILCDEVYKGSKPLGIFAVITKSEDFLFKNRIGAVGMDKFVYHDKDIWSDYSRICVSVRHDVFKEFVSQVL